MENHLTMDTDMNDHDDQSDDTNGDGEGVWSPDIEQCFREALLLFPPCGRRKHILQEEGGGKMYGRNELIARHIKMRTGKSRTRKQVSSHIQVLARRKAKSEAVSSGASAASPSPSSVHSQAMSVRHSGQGQANQQQNPVTNYYDIWEDRPIVTQKIRMVEFSAFIEHRQHFLPNSNPLPVSGVVSNPLQPNPIPVTVAGANSTSEQDLCLQANQATAINNRLLIGSPSIQSPSYPQMSFPSQPTTHPLGSNHQLSAQYNQATFQMGNQFQASPIDQKQAYTQLQVQLGASLSTSNNQMGPQQTATQSPSVIRLTGFTRHSYVRVDYRNPHSRQTNKIERIDINQIQDKFPEIGGLEGLYQRGPSDAFFLVKFWADLNNDFEYNIEDQNSYFGFSSHFETIEPYRDITCSTKACSYGLQVVEKVEKIYGAFNSSNGRYSFDISRSPMCEFMIQFIKKLRQLPRASQMNSVLENFTVLQVITCESTSEILLCLAYVFEVASSDQSSGPQHNVYRLTKD